jgi:hypothetical protein
MLSLMLDPRYKGFHIVFSFIGHGQGLEIVKEYDQITLFPMFGRCHYHLHLLFQTKIDVVDRRIDEDC